MSQNQSNYSFSVITNLTLIADTCSIFTVCDLCDVTCILLVQIKPVILSGGCPNPLSRHSLRKEFSHV